ncbi:unnamed protein product, partial [Meganyctiphanes norvegica]
GSTEFQLNSPLLIIFVSIMGVFLVVIFILVIATRWRKHNDSSASAVFTAVPTVSSPTEAISPQVDINTEVKDGEPSEPKPKPKKKVVLVENGMNDPRSLGDVMNELSSTKDAALGRSTSEKQPLINGSAGYYNSLGKTSFPLNAPSSSSSSTLPRPSILTNKMVPVKRSSSPPARPSQDYPTYTTRFCDSLPRRIPSGSINNAEANYRRSVIGAENFRELDAYLRRSGSGNVYRTESGSGLDSSYRNSMIESSGRFSTYHDRHPGSIGAIDTYHLRNPES